MQKITVQRFLASGLSVTLRSRVVVNLTEKKSEALQARHTITYWEGSDVLNVSQ